MPHNALSHNDSFELVMTMMLLQFKEEAAILREFQDKLGQTSFSITNLLYIVVQLQCHNLCKIAHKLWMVTNICILVKNLMFFMLLLLPILYFTFHLPETKSDPLSRWPVSLWYRNNDMTRSQINDTFLFQSGVKVKVVGDVSEKWN